MDKVPFARGNPGSNTVGKLAGMVTILVLGTIGSQVLTRWSKIHLHGCSSQTKCRWVGWWQRPSTSLRYSRGDSESYALGGTDCNSSWGEPLATSVILPVERLCEGLILSLLIRQPVDRRETG
jgi:hypothetical protein